MIKVKRKTKIEPRYHRNMGRLIVPVIRIQIVLFGVIPVKTIHKYRKTYRGEIKDCCDCVLSVV